MVIISSESSPPANCDKITQTGLHVLKSGVIEVEALRSDINLPGVLYKQTSPPEREVPLVQIPEMIRARSTLCSGSTLQASQTAASSAIESCSFF